MTTELIGFGVVDYIIFILTLCMSAAIGVYFGCFGTKQNSATEYLFGTGRKRVIPIGLSIYSSAVSAITIVGSPTEIYTFGTQFMMIYIGTLLSLIITWNFILPVFCGELKLNTPYEYLELRFNYKVRLMSTAIYVLHTYLYLPVILYAATVAFSEVTNISLPMCTTIIGGGCIFYTMLGGFSAVIWSDTLQATLMLFSCIFVLVKAVINVGGFAEVWDRAERGGRINFFTSTLVGIGGTSIFGMVVCTIGLAMYAQYYQCDPVQNNEVTGSNQLLSHFVASTVKDIPGFLGFFNVGLLCAGLSTISAELNTVSGLIYHCFVKKIFKKTSGEKQGAIIMKLLVLVNGLIYLGVAPIFDKSKYIFSLALGLAGITYGAKVGTMLLGTTFPKSNSLGVICGTVTGILFISWIQFGSMYYDVVSADVLPMTTTNCISNYNFTEIFNSTNLLITTNTNEPLFIYKLSFMYYPLFGTLITVIIALVVSYISGGNNAYEMDPNLFIPYVRPRTMRPSSHETINMLNREDKCVECSSTC